ncbi:MAG: hypothetical protein EU533_01875 [Promethearchaeota archaeon]|nr:MAG: hypothetical protein EU533_01875 [Candidatus Lokiarchaeota archaeon]
MIINPNLFTIIMGKFYSISTIRKTVRGLGKKINAPSHLLTVRTFTDGFGTPHIEIDKNGYNYVICERGSEHERRQTEDITTLLYWILKDVVFIMASDYELEHRDPNEDSRRQLFAKIIDLMNRLDPKFAQWKKKELDNILEENPFDDNL